MVAINTGSNPDFISKMPALIDDADIQTALKLFLYGNVPDVETNATAATGTLTATNGDNGLVGHLNAMRTSLTNASVLRSSFTAKGDLLAGTSSGTLTALNVVANQGHILKVNSATATGLEWYDPKTNLLPREAGNSYPLSGDLHVSATNPKVVLNDTSSTGAAYTEFQDASALKWQVGKNTSDNFVVKNSGGTEVVSISASTNEMSVSQTPTAAASVATKAYVDQSMPVGAIIAYGSSSPPTGWLVCNGQSTSGYSALAAVVGATVPDLRNRFIKGAGSESAHNTTGGTKTVPLPAHTHTGTTGSAGNHGHTPTMYAAGSHSHSGGTGWANHNLNHNHSLNAGLPLWTVQKWLGGSYESFTAWWYVLSATADTSTNYNSLDHWHGIGEDGSHSHSLDIAANGSHTHGFTTDSTGVSASMEPTFYALTYIIKAV